MRSLLPALGWVLVAGPGCGRDLARENTVACESATLAESHQLGDCVDGLGTEDCDFQHDSEACDWVLHYACREEAANAVDDCQAEGAVTTWEETVLACPPADCTPNGADRPFFEEDPTSG